MSRDGVTITPLRVAGEPVGDGEVREVHSPWDDRVVGAVPTVGAAETRAAIDAAWAAMASAPPAHARAVALERAAARLDAQREEMARILVAEIGKPFKQALVEVDRAVQTLVFSAVEARTLTGRSVLMDAHPSGEGHRGLTIRTPAGVVGAITPFNFPLNLAAHKVGPAIAAGCGVVLKPAAKAPLAAVELVRILHDSGVPAAQLSVLVGPSQEIADALIADERVRVLTFTGSSEVGWGLIPRAPRKRVMLELGNSTPLIVCADADLGAAAAAAAASANGFAGQSCISIQRVLVDARVHAPFADALHGAVSRQVLGDPARDDVDLGPMISASDRERVSEWIAEAVDGGARQHGGGSGEGGHLEPVVLDDVPETCRAWHHEIFGPVVGLRSFHGLDEAIDLANGTEYGLQAGIYTRDLNTAVAAAERLEFGGVTINESPTFRVDQMPYGGTKASGNTREGPHYAVREMSEERMVVLGSL